MQPADHVSIMLGLTRPTLAGPKTPRLTECVCIHCAAGLAGILGENLALPTLWTEDIRGFIIINATTLSVCVGTFFWMWRVMAAKKLI